MLWIFTNKKVFCACIYENLFHICMKCLSQICYKGLFIRYIMQISGFSLSPFNVDMHVTFFCDCKIRTNFDWNYVAIIFYKCIIGWNKLWKYSHIFTSCNTLIIVSAWTFNPVFDIICQWLEKHSANTNSCLL